MTLPRFVLLACAIVFGPTCLMFFLLAVGFWS